MPIKHAALKQIRKDRKRRQRNQAMRSELRTLAKRLQGLLEEHKVDEAVAMLGHVSKKFDRAASRRIIHPNTAARYKSRLATQLQSHRAGSGSPSGSRAS
jgi:small subunit ribosomal protein S20